MKQLAPFGNYLANQLLVSDEYQVAIVFMGNSGYARATDFQSHLPYTLCLPAFSSPFKYVWPVKNCEVYLVDTDQSSLSFVRTCALCFFGYGAREVRYVNRYRSLIIEKGISHEQR